MEEVGMPQGKQKIQHENIFYKVRTTSSWERLFKQTPPVAGRQHAGLLQRHAQHPAPAAAQGEGRQEEVEERLPHDLVGGCGGVAGDRLHSRGLFVDNSRDLAVGYTAIVYRGRGSGFIGYSALNPGR